MKLTTEQIKQLIKEELNKLLKESREGGFDLDKETPDAAPEGFEKTYDNVFTSTGEANNKCYDRLEKLIGLCTATTLSINDEGDYEVRIINFNHPRIRTRNLDRYGIEREFHKRDTHDSIAEELWYTLPYLPQLRKERKRALKCYWYPIVDQVREQVFKDERHYSRVMTSRLYRQRTEDERNEYLQSFYKFTTLLAKELRKVQKGEYDHILDLEAGGDTE